MRRIVAILLCMSEIEMITTEIITDNKISKNFNNLHFLLFLIIWYCQTLLSFLTHCFTMMEVSFILSILIIIKDLLIKLDHELTVNNSRQKIKILLTIEVNHLYLNLLYLPHVLGIKTADLCSQHQKMTDILQEMINVSHSLCLRRHRHTMAKPMRMEDIRMIINIETITAMMTTMIRRWHKSMSATTTTSTTCIGRIKPIIMKNMIQVRPINQISHVIRMRMSTSTISCQLRTSAVRNAERCLHLIISFTSIFTAVVL